MNANSMQCTYCGNEHIVQKQGKEIILEYASVWFCPQCHTSTPPGVGFCPKCGYKLSRECPNCKHNISISNDYCSECGVNVVQVVQEYQEDLEYENKIAKKRRL